MIDDEGIETPTTEDGLSPTERPGRVLIGHFSANTDVDELVDLIIASLPPDKRPVEDRPNRLPTRP